MLMIDEQKDNCGSVRPTIGKPTVGSSTVFNEDCMSVMARYPDKYFDLAIVDPPYGIKRDGHTGVKAKNPNHNWRQHEFKGWDNERPKAEYWDELFRVSKNQIVFGANYFTEFIPPSMGWIFWDKNQTLTMSDGELIFTSFNKALRRFILNRGWMVNDGGVIHPTQKPSKLYDWIYDNYAKDAKSIIDTHLGSGSNRIAAHKHNLEFVGCEIDAEYFAAQEARFKEFTSQLRLFG